MVGRCETSRLESSRSDSEKSRRHESAIVQPRRHHRVGLQPGGAVLLGGLRLPARRRRRHAARARAQLLRRRRATSRRCKIGWIRVPGGAVLEIFEFQPQQPPVPIPWNRVGLTHFSFNVRNLQKWHDYLVEQGRRVRQQAGALAARPLVLLREGLRRQPDRADGSRLHVLRARLARPARRLAVQARDVQAVLRVAFNGSRPIRSGYDRLTNQKLAATTFRRRRGRGGVAWRRAGAGLSTGRSGRLGLRAPRAHRCRRRSRRSTPEDPSHACPAPDLAFRGARRTSAGCLP